MSERGLIKLKGLGILLRPVATLSWTGGAFILSAGLASRAIPLTTDWSRLLRVLLVAIVIQGWLSHSLNDRTDWQTGTDQNSNEYFSGGSGALRQGYLGFGELAVVAGASLVAVLLLVRSRAPVWALWLYLAVGLWGAVAYSCRPWRLSYYPLRGEWLAAFPAITACGLASYQVLAKDLVFTAVAAAILHGLLCVCWLMQHHLPDWSRDLQATPPKLTTVAAAAARFGLERARLVVVAYFLLTVVVALSFSLISGRFLWTALLAGLGAVLAYRQDVFHKKLVAFRELEMVGLTLLNAWVIGWVV